MGEFFLHRCFPVEALSVTSHERRRPCRDKRDLGQMGPKELR